MEPAISEGWTNNAYTIGENSVITTNACTTDELNPNENNSNFRDRHNKSEQVVGAELGPTHQSNCAASDGTMQRRCSDRSDRSGIPVRPVVAGQADGEPTNVAREGPVGAGTRRVVLGLAGHLECPQST
jgi:hypothetical protein